MLSKDTINFLDDKDYDPLVVLEENPTLIQSVVKDYPERADELYIKMIDISGERYLNQILDEHKTEAVQRRINRLKLTTQ